MSQNINTLFANKYNSVEWKSLLKVLFKNKSASFYRTTLNRKENDKKAHELADSILEFGDLKLDDNSRILFYEIKLVDDKQINSRVGLRNIIHSDVIPGDVDGIIATYYNEKANDWRLTFISKSLYWDEEYNQIKEETHPKRYTYVLGKGESIKTALNQFDWLFNEIRNKEITIKDLIKTFSVEKISNDFFKKYFDHFKLLVGYISDNPDAFSFFKSQVDNNKSNKEQQEDAEKLVRQFVKKLMGRIVFLYFLQKKGWLGVPANEPWGNGEKDFMSRLFTSFTEKNDFYNKCLAPLFFHTLNKDRKESNDIFEITNTKIPYLNGGLFDKDQIEPDEIRIIPQRFEELFEFFDQYNFTIDENSPDDQDIGIDPEMLGLIFENLLEDNKDKGTFYTPKEVVHFMCKESISQYITDTLQKTASDKELKEITTYIKQSGKIDLEIIKQYAERIDKALTDCKICDPAIGSGAFPMGMVFEIMRLKKELHAFYKQEDFIYLKEKLNIIKNNIYGVDLDKGAVDISRLRFWLSLIVDEKEPKPLPNLDYKIMQGNSLVESFEGVFLGKDIEKADDKTLIIVKPQLSMFGEPEIESQTKLNLSDSDKKSLKDLVELYFSEEEYKKLKISKAEIASQIDTKIHDKLELLFDAQKETLDIQIGQIEYKKSLISNVDKPEATKQKNIKALEKIEKELKPLLKEKELLSTKIEKLYKLQNASERPYFLWHHFFGNVLNEGKKGFDIVIGNPPYGGIKIDDKTQEEYKLASKDPYGAFMSMALNKLLKPNGILCYIVSDTWLTIKSHKPLREQILQYDLKNVIRLHKDCFNATVNSCIFTIKKTVVSSSVIPSAVEGQIIAADLTNISTRKQIPEFREKLFHLEDYIGQYTPEFAVYSYPQSLLQTNSNHPIIVGSPKLFALMNDTMVPIIDKDINGSTIAVRQVEFNKKTIELVRFGDVADVKQGLATGDNKSYLYQNTNAFGTYRDIQLFNEFVLTDDDLEIIRKSSDVRIKVIDNGIHKTKNDSNFDKDCYFEGRYIAPYDKGGESDTDEGWLPNYYVPTDYFIDWSCEAVSLLKTQTILERNKRLGKIGGVNKVCSRFQNKDSYFLESINCSRVGEYSPTYRIATDTIYDSGCNNVFNSINNRNTTLSILCSKLWRFQFTLFINHSVNSQTDDNLELSYPITNEADIEKLDEIVIKLLENQKQNPRYNYFANEQKEIDQLVYELYGLNEEDINEVETWFARRYPKLANYAYYQSAEELLQKQLQQVNTNDKIKQLLSNGESKTVEFKSTLRYCLRQNNPQKYVEHSAIKNLAAFLNSEGGTLFIGVDDDGNILGLENTDFASFKGDNKKDEFVKHFDNLVQNYFGNNMVHKFNVEFETIDNKTIALIHIKDKAKEPVIITNPEKNNQEEFYVRRNASTIALTMYEMLNYSKENWG
ncbi:Eco57I restriction-modification methylase domain-containing protein [Flavobacterium praedii]|uniref:Eco57I restriction-modification methylase domain-containing protein n=1 Tax=Flavobacterium praedii TaxID=3002900 RepID=UPI002481F732|nr:RNA-binding domain-containing protein [Flavobacterium praedii]